MPRGHARVRKLALVRDTGAEGVLLGVPFYFPSTVDNAVRFYQEIAELFPTLGIMIYHNPALHNLTIPVDAFRELAKLPNVVGLKDSHRDTRGFIELMGIVKGKISVFVLAGLYYPYAQLEAAGIWSIEAWMGPGPLLCLRDAIAAGDTEQALEILCAVSAAPTGPPTLQWRETMLKLAVGHAGYCHPGPPRPPFLVIPPEVEARARARAEHWKALCARYVHRSTLSASARS